MTTDIQKYRYKAITKSGRTTHGFMSARDEAHLYEQLKAIDMELVKSNKTSAERGGGFQRFLHKITNRDLLQFFIYLEHMQASEIPLLQCLANARDSTDNKPLQDIIAELTRDVTEGMSLSEAMAKHPSAFNNLCVSIIGAGEESGSVVNSYRYLIEHLKWVDAMQRRVRKATQYPIVVMCVVVAAVVVMMAFVVPQITQFFDFVQDGEEGLPLMTAALLASSEFFQQYWALMVGAGVSLVLIIVFGRKLSDKFAYYLDGILLRLPKIGSLVRKISIVRFVKTFSALYVAGIPISDALTKSKDTVDSLVLKGALEDVVTFINNGKTLSEAMSISGEFPSIVIQMVSTGEEAGRLPPVLEQVAEFYNNEIDEEVSAMVAMIEPMLTGILGGFILWIAVAVFGPIYGVFSDLEF